MHEEDIARRFWNWYVNEWNKIKQHDSGIIIGILSIFMVITSVLVPIIIIGVLSYILSLLAGFSIEKSTLYVVGSIAVIFVLYAIGIHVKER